MRDYDKFIQDKMDFGADFGITPISIPDFLFDFQKYTAEWAIKKGRGAVFEDCGMGKTPIQLVWSDNFVRYTNKPTLILTPLAVTQQTLSEANKFGIEAHRATPGLNKTSVQVINYEKLHYFKADDYGAVVCDESSILKNFEGSYKAEITEFMRRVPYRLLCTATAAPNDFEELGTSSEALGNLGYMDMIHKYFTNKQRSAALMRGRFGRDKWEMRPYAEENFWRWVCSWAIAARNPADLGFDNGGFTLPPLIENDTLIRAERPRDGMLFDMHATNFFEEREVVKRTIKERCEAAAEKISQHNISVAWCHLNEEAKLLKELIPNSIEISGSDSDEKKERAVEWFCRGNDEKRVLISKPKIFGLGLNFQHCNHMTYFPTHSYEQYYQSSRRLWRYGQTKPVIVDRIYTDGGERMLLNLKRKANLADKMFTDLVKYMNDALYVKNIYTRKEIKVPQWLTK